MAYPLPTSLLRDALSYGVVAFSAIFFVVDPIAVVPVFITITEGDSEQKRRAMAWRACVITAAILLTFMVGGGLIFQLFGLTLAAFKIAGGILLLLTSLDMLQSKASSTKATEGEIAEGAGKDDIAVVPLAMPLLSGPGSIATVTMLTAQSTRLWEIVPIVVSIVLTAFISYLVLRAAPFVDRALGKSGQAIVARIMGLLLAAIAVQFVLSGLREAFPELIHQVAAAP